MAKLTEILQKRAVELEQALPKAIVSPIRSGQVPPEAVPEVLESLAATATESAVKRKLVDPMGAKRFNRHIHGYLKKFEQPLQAEAYRATSSVAAPVSPKEIAITGAQQMAFPMVLSRLPVVGGKPIGPGGALSMWLGPEFFLPTAAFSAGFAGLRPLTDPLWRSGKRTYLRSVTEGIRGESENLARAGEEARKRYGIFGVPVQMLHGVMNPLASLYYGGKSIRDLMMGKEGEEAASKAEMAIGQALAKRLTCDVAAE